MNPVTRFFRWWGWTEDQYLTALGYVPLVAAFAAGAYLSFNSLVFLAGKLGYDAGEARAFPIAIDAVVAGCYISQNRLAGLKGFGWHRAYLIALGALAALLTGSGNALHGVIVWKVIQVDPLPWGLLVAGSLVPAIAMAGTGHALMIARSASKTDAAGPLTPNLPMDGTAAGDSPAMSDSTDAPPALPEARNAKGASRDPARKAKKAGRVRAVLGSLASRLATKAAQPAHYVKAGLVIPSGDLDAHDGPPEVRKATSKPRASRVRRVARVSTKRERILALLQAATDLNSDTAKDIAARAGSTPDYVHKVAKSVAKLSRQLDPEQQATMSADGRAPRAHGAQPREIRNDATESRDATAGTGSLSRNESDQETSALASTPAEEPAA